MDPLGSIIVVLQVRGTILAQNPIKGAKRKNRPPPSTALHIFIVYLGVSGFPHDRKFDFYFLVAEVQLYNRKLVSVSPGVRPQRFLSTLKG